MSEDTAVRRDEPAEVPGERRPDPDLLSRPSLAPPRNAARDRRRRWREAGAAVRWIARAWLDPAGAEARWEQRAGRESLPRESFESSGRSEESRGAERERPDEPGRGGRRPAQGQSRTSGSGQ